MGKFKDLTAKGVVAGYSQYPPVFHGLSLRLLAGERGVIIGPNGSGKSTLLKVLSGCHAPISGSVTVGGEDLYKMKGKNRARTLTRVSQTPRLNLPFTVEQFISFGRYPHQRFGSRHDVVGHEAIAQAMRWTNLEQLASKPLTALSGGEKQRAVLAQALAQNTPCLLLDEPNAFLDLRHQLGLLNILHDRNRSDGVTVLAVLHDINLAARFANRVFLLSHGEIYSEGSPEAVLTEENLEAVYGVRVAKVYTPDGTMQFIFMPQGTEANVRLPYRLHIIGGGGSAGLIMPMLYRAGFNLSVGVILQGDTDLQVAEYLGVPVVSAPTLGHEDEEVFSKVWDWVEKSDGVVVADTCFGTGNLVNLRLALDGQKKGKKVWMVEETPFEQKDYSGGAAKALRDQLIENGAFVITQAHHLPESICQRLKNT